MEFPITNISVSRSLDSDLKAISNSIRILYIPVINFFLTHYLKFFKKNSAAKISMYLDDFYLTIIGSIDMAKSYSGDSAKNELKRVRSSIIDFGHVIKTLETVSYFDNEILKDKSNNCLRSLFDLERSLKTVATNGNGKPLDETVKMAMRESSKRILEKLN